MKKQKKQKKKSDDIYLYINVILPSFSNPAFRFAAISGGAPSALKNSSSSNEYDFKMPAPHLAPTLVKSMHLSVKSRL